ncbi:hypothetical protein AC791_08495 [Klebsiella sp. RIT-PI-d]|nr:hypothetical protein AC791_08495 [Klebsiella sp. RIT-PI-d]
MRIGLLSVNTFFTEICLKVTVWLGYEQRDVIFSNDQKRDMDWMLKTKAGLVRPAHYQSGLFIG